MFEEQDACIAANFPSQCFSFDRDVGGFREEERTAGNPQREAWRHQRHWCNLELPKTIVVFPGGVTFPEGLE